MKKLKSCGLILLIFILAMIAFQYPWGACSPKQSDNRPRTSDGLVDFLKISNAELAKDITVDNNVVVDIVQIYGVEHRTQEEYAEQFLTLLGDPAIPESGHLQECAEFLSESDPNFDAGTFGEETYPRLLERPWADDEFPLVVKWLEQEKNNLDQLVSGSKKPYYFHPLCNPNGGSAIGALLPFAQIMRDGVRCLNIRAMNHLANDRVKEALVDIQSMRQLGKLMDQSPTLVEHLVGYALLGIAFNAEHDVIESLASGVDLSDEAIQDYRNFLDDCLPRSLSTSIRMGERNFSLDTIQRLESGDMSTLEMFGQRRDRKNLTFNILARWTNWDIAREKSEALYERIANACDIEDAGQRKTELKEIERGFVETEKELTPGKMALRALSGANGRGDVIGDILVNMMGPAINQLDEARNRAFAYQRIGDLGFALEQYRRINGSFPEDLNSLTPELVEKIESDLLSGTPHVYRKTTAGYRLWSNGPNNIPEQADGSGNLIDWGKVDPMDRNCDDVVIGVGGLRKSSDQ